MVGGSILEMGDWYTPARYWERGLGANGGDRGKISALRSAGGSPLPSPLLGEPNQTRLDLPDGLDHLVRGVERGFVRGLESASCARVLVLRCGDGGRSFRVRDRSRVEPSHPRSCGVVRRFDAGERPGCGQVDLDDVEQ